MAVRANQVTLGMSNVTMRAGRSIAFVTANFKLVKIEAAAMRTLFFSIC
jgi:hypothetical protein